MRLIQTLSSCLCTGIIALYTACSQAPQSPVWLQSQRLRLEERTRVGHFQKGEDGDVQEIVVGMIVPGGRCELLVQEVAADHESLVALHLRRGRMQQPGCTIRQLGKGRKGKAAKQNDKE